MAVFKVCATSNESYSDNDVIETSGTFAMTFRLSLI